MGSITRSGAPTFLLTSGRVWSPFAPDPHGFEYIDIAAGLARICRFSGHFQAPGERPPYMVGQHCVLGAEAMPRELQLAFLLHDAPEALTGFGDPIGPLKRMIPALVEVERAVEAAIAKRFGLEPGFSEWPEVKAMDKRMLATEDRDLRNREGTSGAEPLPDQIVPWGWSLTEHLYMAALRRITGRDS